MMKSIKRPQKDTERRILEQAEKTAWKLISDDVDIQLSLIEIDQKKFIEAFLSSVYDIKKNQTFFEKIESSGFPLLEDRSK